MNRSRNNTTRRDFLKRTSKSAAAIGAATFIPAAALGKDGNTAASERIVMGCIGTGGMGKHDMGKFLGFKDVQVVAVCDVDKKHLAQAKGIVNGKYKNQDCKTFDDFRKLLELKDIDAVTVTTPDHWHALASIAAAKAGKDIYCEKPLANSIGEGRAICDAVNKHKRILQTGSHERSGNNARYACELVRNGRIGKLHTLRVNLPCDQNHHKQVRAYKDKGTKHKIPDGLNYDMWLGHTAKVSYHPDRCHFWWRFVLAYGGGEMTDRGAHVIDLAQLGANTDDTGPVEISAKGVAAKNIYDSFFDYEFENTFANGLKLIGSSKGKRGVKFEGDDGWIFIHVHGARLEASDPAILKEKIKPNEIQLGRSPGHQRNFADCVKSRKSPMASHEVGHRTATICHLNNIAMLTGKKLKWDPKKEQITNDKEANKMVTPTMRKPWSI